METQKLTKIVKIVTTAATLFVCTLLVVIIFEYVKINSLNKKIDNVSEKINEQEQLLASYNEDTKNHSSSIYMEDVARRELGRLNTNESYIEFE